MAGEIFEPKLQSYEKLGVLVGSTHLLADKILEHQIHELEKQTFSGMQGDAAYSYKTKTTNLLSA